MAKKKKKRRLIEGRAFHRPGRCELCEEQEPAVRSMIDHENKLEIVDRHAECNEHVIDFSVGLECGYAQTAERFYVIRCCSEHRNFHTHHMDPLHPGMKKYEMVEEHHTINSAEEANEAYKTALKTVAGDGVQIWWDKWRRYAPYKSAR